MQFSRTPFHKGATDGRWVTLKRSTCTWCAHLRRTTMLRKLTLGLVAAATLSAIALAPSAASAKPFGGGWGGWGFHHHHWSHGFGVCFIVGGDDVGDSTRPWLMRLA